MTRESKERRLGRGFFWQLGGGTRLRVPLWVEPPHWFQGRQQGACLSACPDGGQKGRRRGDTKKDVCGQGSRIESDSLLQMLSWERSEFYEGQCKWTFIFVWFLIIYFMVGEDFFFSPSVIASKVVVGPRLQFTFLNLVSTVLFATWNHKPYSPTLHFCSCSSLVLKSSSCFICRFESYLFFKSSLKAWNFFSGSVSEN